MNCSGCGALLFYLLNLYPQKQFFFNDINEELISAFDVVNNDVNELIVELKEHP